MFLGSRLPAFGPRGAASYMLLVAQALHSRTCGRPLPLALAPFVTSVSPVARSPSALLGLVPLLLPYLTLTMRRACVRSLLPRPPRLPLLRLALLATGLGVPLPRGSQRVLRVGVCPPVLLCLILTMRWSFSRPCLCLLVMCRSPS